MGRIQTPALVRPRNTVSYERLQGTVFNNQLLLYQLTIEKMVLLTLSRDLSSKETQRKLLVLYHLKSFTHRWVRNLRSCLLPIIPLCLSREEGVIVFPLEPKKQRSKKIIIITPDLRLMGALHCDIGLLQYWKSTKNTSSTVLGCYIFNTFIIGTYLLSLLIQTSHVKSRPLELN